MESIAALSSTSLFKLPAFSFSGYSVSRTRPLFPFCSRVKAIRVSENAHQADPADPKPKEAKLWGGRFEDSVTDAVERFTESISYDKQLYKHDVMGSRAHASMLAHQVTPRSCDW